MALSLLIGCSGLASSAQSPTVGPGAFRCAGCAETGQKPAPPVYDESQVEFVANPIPVVFEDRGLQVAYIARVLSVSPLVLEVLDTEGRTLDRTGKVIGKLSEPNEPSRCGINRIEAIDSRSKPMWRTLQFNDLITATGAFARSETRPDSPLDAKFVLTDLRKASAPVAYFEGPGRNFCANRSGALVVYYDAAVDRVTVFNDGGIHYRDPLFRGFARERLSPAELSDLLALFDAVNFDALPGSIPARDRHEQSTLTLIGARYQNVSTVGREAVLASLIRRMEAIAGKATSHTSFVIQPGVKTKLTILPWPYPQIRLDGWQAFRSRGWQQRSNGARETPDRDVLFQRLPDDFLAKLPLTSPFGDPQTDPNRFVYFTQDGRLYHVTHNPGCHEVAPGCKTFDSLDANEVRPPQFTGDFRMLGPILGGSYQVWVWPREMGIRLADVTADTVIGRDEYAAHEPIYFTLLKSSGWNVVEDGYVYEKLRVCQIEPGTIDERCGK
jgi:hypothetical protein